MLIKENVLWQDSDCQKLFSSSLAELKGSINLQHIDSLISKLDLHGESQLHLKASMTIHFYRFCDTVHYDLSNK